MGMDGLISSLYNPSGLQDIMHLPLFIAYDFDGYVLVGFIVVRFHHLTERSFSQHLHDFIAIHHVIT